MRYRKAFPHIQRSALYLALSAPAHLANDLVEFSQSRQSAIVEMESPQGTRESPVQKLAPPAAAAPRGPSRAPPVLATVFRPRPMPLLADRLRVGLLQPPTRTAAGFADLYPDNAR